jgi:hypothetical protein
MMVKVLNKNGFLKQLKSKRMMNNTRILDKINLFLMKTILFSFTANRWLSEEKDDKKTYIDLSPDEEKPPTPIPKKGLMHKFIVIFMYLFDRSSDVSN